MSRYIGSTGVEIIDEERDNQHKHGYTPNHDAQHGVRDLLNASVAYMEADPDVGPWPWDVSEFKPTDRLTNLAKAGALIAAAIDLLLLAESEA